MSEPSTVERSAGPDDVDPDAVTDSSADPADSAERGATATAVRLLESRTLEVVLATVLVLISTAYFARFVHAMATTSLWNDEVWSVLNFSSRGPGESVTSVNNAIVVNLVNSILPGSDSLDPLRVRAISMVAIVAMLLLGLGELVRRRWYLPGALLFFVFAVNFSWLDTTLQARGYGILGLTAMAASTFTWRHLEDGRTRWLVGIAIASIIGIWTVPSFAFFAGPLWVLLIVVRRDPKVVLAAVAAGIGVLALYGPLIGDLWTQSKDYSASFGYQYGTVVAPFRTVRNFLWERAGASPLTAMWLVALVAPALVALPSPQRLPAFARRAVAVAHVDVPRAARRTVWVLAAAAASVFVIALVLRTPPQRTVAYVVVPIAVITALSIGVLRDGTRFRSAWRAFSLAAGVLGCVAGVFAFVDLSFTPIEDWRGAATYIESTFPDGTEVYAVTRGDYLEAHLSGGRELASDLSVAGVDAGTMVVSAFDPTDEVADVRDSLGPNLAQMDVAQRRGTRPPESFPILFAPPTDRHVERVEVDGVEVLELADGDLGTTVDPASTSSPTTLDIALSPSTTARSLVVPLTGGEAPSAVEVEATGPDGATWTVEPGAIDVTNRLVTVHLGDREVASVRLTLVPATSGATAVPRDVWVYSP